MQKVDTANLVSIKDSQIDGLYDTYSWRATLMYRTEVGDISIG